MVTAGFRWIGLRRIEWQDAKGKDRVWESAERLTTSKATQVDAVVICPILRHPSRPLATCVVKQFRPPLGKFTVEFPAGLVDQTETVPEAALRELHEETGYIATVRDVSVVSASDPGLSAATLQLVTVDVDLSMERNVTPVAQLDDGEDVEVEVVPLSRFKSRLVELTDQGMVVDGKLWHFAYGFDLATSLSK